MSLLKGFLVIAVAIGLFACGKDSPVQGGLSYKNEGSLSAPVQLNPGTVTSAHVGDGTSYYYAVVSPGATYTVTLVLQTYDSVVLQVRKGGFSFPIACSSATGGTKEECSVAMSALDTSIYIEVTNDNTIAGTPFTLWVH